MFEHPGYQGGRAYDAAVRGGRIRAVAGLVGPAAFTVAWILAGRRQDGYRIRDEHISGLAARDATDPEVMTAGFLTLGACTVAFGSALERRLAPRPGWGPALIGAAGLATIAAGLFRRDRRSNFPVPGMPPGQSWENHVHDAAGVAVAATGTAGLFALAPRLASDASLRGLAGPAVSAGLASVGLSTWFLRDVVRPWNGMVQRVSVTIPLVFMARLALRVLTERQATFVRRTVT
jgi:Protein of unknown function (DUF998)